MKGENAVIPHRLEMEGFGSYIKKTVLDFDKTDNVFLINGATGAGKTLILDAIVYALYGESSGGRESLVSRCLRGDNRRMRVCFVFGAAGRTYEAVRTENIIRSRKKSDNDEFRTRSEAEIFDITESRVQINPKNTFSSANDTVKNILHMSREQFCQIVVLPQGKIEKLLTGNSGQKEELFEELFGTAALGEIVDILKKDCGQDSERLREEKIRLETYYKPDFESAEDMKKYLENLRKSAAEKKEFLEKIKKEYELFLTEKKKDEVLFERFKKLDERKEELKKLLSSKSAYDEKKIRLKKLNAQIDSMPEYTEFSKCKDDFSQREKNLEKARSEYLEAKENKNEYDTLLQKLDASAEEYDLMRDEVKKLSELFPVYEKIEEAKNSLLKKEKEKKNAEMLFEKTDKKYNTVDKEIAGLKEKISELESEKLSEKKEALSEKMIGLKRGRELSEELRKIIADQNENNKKLSDLKNELEKAAEKSKTESEEYSALYESYIKSLALSLSENLKEGEKCPVCGSVHHPEVFHPTEESFVVSEDKLKKKKKSLDSAKEKADSLSVQLHVIEKAADDFSEKISENKKKIEELMYTEEAFAETEKEIGLVNEKLDAYSELCRYLEEKRNELEKISLKRMKEHENLNILSGECFALNKQYAIYKEQIRGDIEDKNALSEKTESLKEEIKAFDKKHENAKKLHMECEKQLASAEALCKTAEHEFILSQTKMNNAESTLKNKLIKNNITESAEEFVPDKKGIEEAEALRAECADYDVRLDGCRMETDQLSEELKDSVCPDMDKIGSLDKAHTDRIRKAEIDENNAAIEAERIGRRCEEYSIAYEEYEEHTKEFAEINDFVNMMAGGRKMSFQRYVLGIMLDRVLEQANIMLDKVLDSNFRLYKHLSDDGRSKTGLDINVRNYSVDSAGAYYPVTMLSGGEKFVMSVILGLAVSVAVQNRTGGIEVDSLFIDEGFGTLDEDALMQIMRVINSYGSRRKIGIISHVGTLSDVLPTGFEVCKTQNGGSFALLRGNA